MGGAARTFSDVGRGFADFAQGEGPAGALNFAAYVPQALNRTYEGVKTMQRAPREAEERAAAANLKQQQQAQEMQKKLLERPKTISADNFLSMKAKQLASLRLGLSSTMTGSRPLSGGGSGKELFGT